VHSIAQREVPVTNEQMVIVLLMLQKLLDKALLEVESALPASIAESRVTDSGQPMQYFPALAPLWGVSVELSNMVDTLQGQKD
jgi:hypothetical protein